MSSATPTPASASPPSPPTRPGADRKQSHTESDNTAYSLDFAALPGASKDDADFSLNGEPLETVRSEDIDGPSDFTQNMELWMRGQVSPKTERPTRHPESPEQQHQESQPSPARTAPALPQPEIRYNGERTESPEPIQEEENNDPYESEDDEAGAQAAMDDLEGYVISDEQDEEGPKEPPRQGSIDKQIELLSSMNDGNEAKQDVVPSPPRQTFPSPPRQIFASPPRPTYGELKPASPARMPWLQPTVEDHVESPPRAKLDVNPPSRSDTPELKLDSDFFRRPHPNIRPTFSRTNSAASSAAFRPSMSRHDSTASRFNLSGNSRPLLGASLSSRPMLTRHNSWAPSGQFMPPHLMMQGSAPSSVLPSRTNSAQHAGDLLSQITQHNGEIERQKLDFTSRIIGLEKNLEKTRTDLAGARDNEQRRVREVTAQHNERVRELEAHWGQRLAMAQAQYQRDLQEQKASFALVQSSFESRLSGTESGLQALLSQKEAELEASTNTHKQELEQQRVGFEAKVSSLEERLCELQNKITEQAKRDDLAPNRTDYFRDSAPKEELEQHLAAHQADSHARIAELEATLATTKAQLASMRSESLTKGKLYAFHSEDHKQSEQQIARYKTQVADLESSLSVLQTQLNQTRNEASDAQRDVHNARESAHVLRTELSESQSLVGEKKRRNDQLRDELEEERTKVAANRDMARMLENAREELEDERSSSTERIRQLEMHLDDLEDEHKNELDNLREKAMEAVRKSQTLVNGERIEKASLKNQLKGARTEVDMLKQQVQQLQNQRRRSDSSRSDGKGEEMERLRAALLEQANAAKMAKAEAEALRMELRIIKDDNESVNQAMDDRIVVLVRQREREWKARYEKLQQEKKAMGRALLRQWGQEECGVTDPQEYKYHYVDVGK
ncbi:uncharacterized protein K452DRAFT_359872 [Aplosporella prunicola CBS 121167]|uniref:Uncharacterized protein n=1 Tax=Aplosporella prunicola CBS 121167 TaxID=1176127 RepID=A0A6A6B9G7_9PEZI|nr:uncharacterized protein K452DRAFT_359872 [Aplosporella prunicola CBS 121167]KAF2140208.1 hypothetical protein K452DRAFT_359872 [Aplosporella prunicola CBS 121167]